MVSGPRFSLTTVGCLLNAPCRRTITLLDCMNKQLALFGRWLVGPWLLRLSNGHEVGAAFDASSAARAPTSPRAPPLRAALSRGSWFVR